MLNELLALVLTSSVMSTACDRGVDRLESQQPSKPDAALGGSGGAAVGAVGTPGTVGTPGAVAAPQPAARAPRPDFEVRDDSAALLLTWVDRNGEFHVVDTVGEVPEGHRNLVRVVFPGSERGTGDRILLVDLTDKRGDGSYPLSSETRTQWLAHGAKERKAKLKKEFPKLAAALERKPATKTQTKTPPTAEGKAAAPAELSADKKKKSAADSKKKEKAAPKIKAIVYGASWCKPCKKAEKYLKSKGVDVTKKDVEEDEAARKEMQRKLKKVSREGAQIPIIDLAGQIIVGFNRAVLDKALAKARDNARASAK